MRFAFLAVLLASSIALGGCIRESPPPEDDDDDDRPGPGMTGNATQTLNATVSTSGQYPVNPGFDPTTLMGRAGQRVNLTFRNTDAAPLVDHNWVLEGVDGAETPTIPVGQSAQVEFRLPSAPGDIAYYCSVGDHRERGMEGTFTVTSP